ncbi:MAG TPA: hypothetical protein VD931_03210 [Baekduia sp.]|nr:hypothetical protein [Baekduia sp.]
MVAEHAEPPLAEICLVCGGSEWLHRVCRDCGQVHSEFAPEPLGLEPLFVWRPTPDGDGDLELVRGNRAGIVFTRGGIERMRGKRATEMYADEPAIVEALRHVAATRDVLVEHRRYRMRSAPDDERDVAVVLRPGCRDLVFVVVLDAAPAQRDRELHAPA